MLKLNDKSYPMSKKDEIMTILSVIFISVVIVVFHKSGGHRDLLYNFLLR